MNIFHDLCAKLVDTANIDAHRLICYAKGVRYGRADGKDALNGQIVSRNQDAPAPEIVTEEA